MRVDAHLDTLLSRFCADCSDARKTMFHRTTIFFVPLVLMALCGVSAGQEDVPALIHKLKDEDRWVRLHAAFALGGIGPAAKEAVPALIAALKDKDRLVRQKAVLALVYIGPAAKEVVPALIAALKDEEVRGYAAYALGEIGPAAKEAVPALEAAARDGVSGAESALKKIRDDG